MKKKKIVIEYKDLQALQVTGAAITTTPAAEEAIVALLTLQKDVEAAIEEMKKVIAEEALKINPNFSSIKSDRVKVAYKTYGSKYSLDESKLGEIPEGCYSKVVKYAPVAKAIEKYLEENKCIPDGIVENIREKQLSVKLVEEDKDHENA